MLISPKLTNSIDPIHQALAEVISHGRREYVYGPGLVMMGHWNPDFVIDRKTFYHGYKYSVELNPNTILHYRELVKEIEEKVPPHNVVPDYYKENLERTKHIDTIKLEENYKKPRRTIKDTYSDEITDMYLGNYGVCDSPEQLLDIYDFEKDERKLFICFVEIRREDQPAEGGWRYHKWGEYVGLQKPENEYIYYDTHIEKVYTYHVYEMK